MPRCPNCTHFYLTGSKFCSSCAANLKAITVIDIETGAEIVPSPSPTNEFGTITNEVRKQKELQRLKDQYSNSSIPSSFGIDPKSTVGLVHQQVELWISFKGEAPQRQPNGCKLWALNPRQRIDSFDILVRTFARTVKGWEERCDEDEVEEDFNRYAWVGVLLGGGRECPTDLGFPQFNQTVQDLINILKDFKKDKVTVILPVVRKSTNGASFKIEDDEQPLKLKRKYSKDSIATPETKVRKDKKPVQKPSNLKISQTYFKQEQDQKDNNEKALIQQMIKIKEEELEENKETQ